MMWLDYTIESFPDGSFRVRGDWPGEVMGWTREGETTGGKENPLYQPGDVFIVDKNGVLRKQEGLQKMMMKFEKDPSLWT